MRDREAVDLAAKHVGFAAQIARRGEHASGRTNDLLWNVAIAAERHRRLAAKRATERPKQRAGPDL